MKRIVYMLLAVFMMAVSSTPLHAADQLINIQFGGQDTYTGKGGIITDPASQTWNDIPGTEKTNRALVTSTGGTTTAKISFTSDAAVTEAYSYVKFSTPENNLMSGYIYSSSNDDTITFTGLKANSQYTLYVYSQSEYTSGNNYGDGQQLHLSVNGGATTLTSALSVGNTSTFVDGRNFLTTTVTTNSSGALVIAYNSPIGGNTVTNRGVINGLQLRGPATPEPASLVLLGIGGLLGARRLKKKSDKTSVPAV